MLFTSIVAHLEVLRCMHKFNLETCMLTEVVKMLNMTSLILSKFNVLRSLNLEN